MMRVQFPEGSMARDWIGLNYRIRQFVREVAKAMTDWSYRR